MQLIKYYSSNNSKEKGDSLSTLLWPLHMLHLSVKDFMIIAIVTPNLLLRKKSVIEFPKEV